MNTFTRSYMLYITDKDNNTIFESQVGNIMTLPEGTFPQIYLTSNKDHIYIASGNTCIVLDEDGSKIKTHTISGNISSIQLSSDGDVYIFGYGKNNNMFLSIIDEETNELKDDNTYINDIKTLSGSTYYMGNDGNIYVSSEVGITSYNINTKEITQAINWVNSGLFAGNISNIIPITSDQFFIYGSDVINNQNGLWYLNRIPDNEIQQKEVIRITYIEDGRNTIPLAAIKFNSKSDQYHIICEEYSSHQIDSNVDLYSQYDLDILTGKIGDIVVMENNTEYEKYADKGIFQDLYELMENDKDFSVDNLYECVKTPFEINGKLYTIFPEFTIRTLAGKTKNLPNETWNIKTLLNVLETLPDEVSIMPNIDKTTLYNMFLLAGAGEFIDFENSICSFNSDEFISLIEYINSFPQTNENIVDYNDNSPFINDEIYLDEAYIGSLSDYLMLRVKFGFDENIKMIGFPSKQGGSAEIVPSKYYAITSTCENKSGAWEFIKYLLSGDVIINEMRGMRNIPSSRETFNEWIEREQMLYYFFPYGTGSYYSDTKPISEEDYGMAGYSVELTEEILNEFENCVNTISSRTNIPISISQIITEDLNISFAGDKTAKETANIIQSRVSIYLSENG